MEPASLDNRTRAPRSGSLENPLVVENVPGHVIPILEREFDDFETESTRYLDGKLTEQDFIKFRLKQGVYGQRQPDVQMIRVKLPMGGVTPDQLDAFADVIERYAPLRKGHVTTRQNIQMHHVPLTDVPAAIRELADAGLSSREGCGNTMRNVTGDPRAGTLVDEPFDITPYAAAYVRYFVRHPTTQAMPRKVKTAFAANDADNAITGIHDMAFLPRVRDGVRGVEIRVGGGTSIMPRIAPTLYEFVELDSGDYLKVTEACMRIFDRQDFLRVNRARARIKVLIDKIGIDAFREQVEEELQGDWVAERDFSPDGLLLFHDERAHLPVTRRDYASPNGDRRAFDAFAASNVAPQRQRGFQTRRGQDPARRPHARAAARPGRDHASPYGRLRAHDRASESGAAVGPRRGRLRGLARALGARARRRRGRRDHRCRLVPGHRFLQARDHQLDGAQPGGVRSGQTDEHQRPADAPNPHQDERLPKRLQPAPHRRHRLLRCLDQGRRARRFPPISRTSAVPTRAAKSATERG